MGTIIRAIVSMVPDTPITITNLVQGGATPITARPMSAASCNIMVPACTSSGQFPANHITVDYWLPTRLTGLSAATHVPTTLYENFDRVRFVVALDQIQAIRFANGTVYGNINDYVSTGWNDNRARPLASSRDGGEFQVSGHPEAILVLDERFWLICYSIGQ